MDHKRSTPSSNRPTTHILSSPIPPAVDNSNSNRTSAAAATPRQLYSSRLGHTQALRIDNASTFNTTTSRRRPLAPRQRASYTRSSDTPDQQNSSSTSTSNRPALNSFFNRVKEGQRVQLTVNHGAEFEDIYANDLSEPNWGNTRMVQKKIGSADTMNGSGKRQSAMPYTRGGMNKSHSGNRSSFQTDSNISGGRLGDRRELQRWDAGDSGNGLLDGGLEDTDSNKPWDQFAANAEKFGVQTDYDENIYTTSINRSDPAYKDKLARADRLARKIEGSTATSAHAAEERMVDHVGAGDDGADEEDKYSGVKRQDFPPLGSQSSNKYTPPARRAPTGSATVKGAPVDPAIISSQLRSRPSKQTTPKPEEAKSPAPSAPKAPEAPKSESKPGEAAKEDVKPAENAAAKGQSESKTAEKPTTALRSSVTSGRNGSLATKENQPIEKEVLAAFKSFGDEQRQIQKGKEKAAKSKKLDELKAFAAKFKLGTPVPNDLIGIIAKDPKKQQEIQDKARKNAEEVQRSKDEAKKVETAAKEQGVAAAKPGQSKSSEQVTTTSGAGTPTSGADSRGGSRPGAQQPHANAVGPGPNRHPGNRQSYAPGYQQQFRGDRAQGQNMPRHAQQGGPISTHLRNGEQQRMMQQPHRMAPDVRVPPTGPANAMGPPAFAPRHAGLANHMAAGPRLNPSTQEFRPNAQPFIPAGPSAASSPRSVMNNVEQGAATTLPPPVIRRKIKTIDVKKCLVLSHVQSIKPPQAGNRAWEENGGLRPAFDTLPTWRTIREEDNKDKISYKQLFERPPYSGTLPTPSMTPVMPQMAHQHQLPFHLQQGAQNAVPRQSPHMPPMQMHAGHPAHGPHVPFNNGDDGTRMMHSSSTQSYASPRPGQVPMANFNMMNSPSHMPYSQPVMPGFMGPGGPPMTPQMRNSFQAPQYMPQQHGQMGPPMMMGPGGYMTAPSPLMQGTPQMPMAYPGGHPNFVPPGVPPQAMQGANGYPSPGRPAAPMMAHQGSQQGQHMYGMSPGMPQYQQPVFAPQQPGQMGNMRAHSNPGPQQLGTSPQQMHQHGPQQNRGNNYGGKNFSGPPQGPSPSHAGPQARSSDAPEEAK